MTDIRLILAENMKKSSSGIKQWQQS